jgi:hypothetical protein
MGHTNSASKFIARVYVIRLDALSISDFNMLFEDKYGKTLS